MPYHFCALIAVASGLWLVASPLGLCGHVGLRAVTGAASSGSGSYDARKRQVKGVSRRYLSSAFKAFLLFSMRLLFPLRSRGLGLSRTLAHPAIRTPAFPKTQFQQNQPRRLLNMNAQELTQYLADAPPAVVRLEIEKHFEALSDKQKRYAHFISK